MMLLIAMVALIWNIKASMIHLTIVVIGTIIYSIYLQQQDKDEDQVKKWLIQIASFISVLTITFITMDLLWGTLASMCILLGDTTKES